MQWVLLHGVHLVPLLGLGGWFAWTYAARSRLGRARLGAAASGPLEARRALMACSVGAAVVHADVIGAHFRESALYGWFFSLAALAQLTWGVLVARRADRALLVCGVVGNGLIVALWLLTRTAGLPVGPEPWQAETVGVLDVLATVLEVGLVAGALFLLVTARRRGGRTPDRPVEGFVGINQRAGHRQ